MAPNILNFIGGTTGPWEVTGLITLAGEPIAPVTHLAIRPGVPGETVEGKWMLQGVISNLRYAEQGESSPLGRSGSPGPSRGLLRGAHSAAQVSGVVGAGPGRAAGHLRKCLAPHPNRLTLPARHFAAALSLPGFGWPVRFSDLV